MELSDLLDLHALGGDFAELYDFVNAGKSCAVVALGPAERAHIATHLADPCSISFPIFPLKT